MNLPQIGEIRLGKEDLAGPVSMSFDFHDHFHLFCMSAARMDDPEVFRGEPLVKVAAKLQKQLRFDDRCLKFGDHVVILQPQPFIERMRQVMQRRGKWFRAALVEYYDEATFHGSFAPFDAPFNKQKPFGYQKEYRLCVQTNTEGDDPLVVELGDLFGFSYKLRSEDLNAAYKVNVQSIPETTAQSEP